MVIIMFIAITFLALAFAAFGIEHGNHNLESQALTQELKREYNSKWHTYHVLALLYVFVGTGLYWIVEHLCYEPFGEWYLQSSDMLLDIGYFVSVIVGLRFAIFPVFRNTTFFQHKKSRMAAILYIGSTSKTDGFYWKRLSSLIPPNFVFLFRIFTLLIIYLNLFFRYV